MQSGERADQVFSHPSTTRNGFETITPEFDPLNMGRESLLLDALEIFKALNATINPEVRIVEMFEPSHEQQPAPQPVETPPKDNLSQAAFDAAKTTSATNEQFALVG